jgi:hypothetical protein
MAFNANNVNNMNPIITDLEGSESIKGILASAYINSDNYKEIIQKNITEGRLDEESLIQLQVQLADYAEQIGIGGTAVRKIIAAIEQLLRG